MSSLPVQDGCFTLEGGRRTLCPCSSRECTHSTKPFYKGQDTILEGFALMTSPPLTGSPFYDDRIIKYSTTCKTTTIYKILLPCLQHELVMSVCEAWDLSLKHFWISFHFISVVNNIICQFCSIRQLLCDFSWGYTNRSLFNPERMLVTAKENNFTQV